MDVRKAALAILALVLVSIGLFSCGGSGSGNEPTPTYNILPSTLPTPDFNPIIRENKLSRADATAAAEEWMREKGVEWFCSGVEAGTRDALCTLEVRCDLNQYNERMHIWLFTCATGIEPLRPGAVLVFEVSVSDDTGFATGI